MMTTNVPLLRTPAGRGSLFCESGPIYFVSFYLITRHNSLIITEGFTRHINWGLGLRCLHTSIFIKTPFLEGLPTKAKEDFSTHEMRLSPAGHQLNISFSRGISLLLLLILLLFRIHLLLLFVVLIFIITTIIIII